MTLSAVPVPSVAVARRRQFKQGIDAEEGRRKREEHMVQLRKAKREESHAKRRMVRVGAFARARA